VRIAIARGVGAGETSTGAGAALALGTWLAIAAAASLPGVGALADEERPFLTLATTTSTQDSGLLDALLPRFTAETGIDVRVVAVGTGRAIEIGRAGDADVLLVHDRASEDAFVASGHAALRRDVMYNDFLVIGPAADPAGARGSDVVAAFAAIADARATFVSRGDDSGTHKAERRLWTAAAREPRTGSGRWYLESGGGMAATLGLAAEKNAYALTDRATWLATASPGSLVELVSGDARLRNAYGVLVVSAAKHPGVKSALGERLAVWLTSAPGREAIAAFRIAGRQVFFVE
jgi:tungstate transport system substrate-binding protein